MRRTSYLELISIVITGVLCTLTLSGCNDFVTKGTNGKVFDGASAFGTSYDTTGYEAGNAVIDENIESLDIDWISGDVTIDYHNDDTVIIEESSSVEISEADKMQYAVIDGTLKIKFCKSNTWNSKLKKELMVTLPEGIKLKNFKYDSASSNLKFNDIYVDTFDADLASGSIHGNRLEASNEVQIDSASGGFTIDDYLSASKLDYDSTSGAVKINDSDVTDKMEFDLTSGNIVIGMSSMCDIDIDCISSKIDLAVPTDASFTLDFDSISGNVNLDCDAKIKDGRYYIGEGKNRVNISSTSGSVNIVTN